MTEQGTDATTARRRIRVEGIVQGVGFRPHVHRLAQELGVTGWVGNDARGVVVEVEGPPARLDTFLQRLRDDAPPLADIERFEADEQPPRGDTAFTIVPSPVDGTRRTPISPDVATCDACRTEILDPDDRRYGYAFTNCTDCGPRYTIVRDVPYDRPLTTMASFAMCEDCAAEYEDPTDRRFHAQPVCCPRCGPQLRLVSPSGHELTLSEPGDEGSHPRDPIEATAALLRDGAVLAIKGLGGYHLAADAAHPAAAAKLRAGKHREDKPFAVMVSDLDMARSLGEVGEVEARLLAGPEAPIVLVRRRPDAPLADAVAPGNRWIGLLLPYTPLHHLLCAAYDAPFVLTSGNLSDEPIAHADDDAFTRLGPIADAVLTHDRPIHMRVDDSVVRVVHERPMVLRRARGFAPRPLPLPVPARRHVLAVGAELKSTVCVAKERRAIVSHHLGDLESLETFEAFLQAIEHLQRLFDVRPEVIAHDLHPEYLSTKHALELVEGSAEAGGGAEVELVGIQHHHAHVASCLVDNGRADPVIGVAFDGTGYGTDATLWGGEFLVADLRSSQRVGSLRPVPLPGGASAIRQPWRMAVSHLDVAYGGDLPDVEVVRRDPERVGPVLAVARSGRHAPMTSSVGRLFDAVAAILAVREEVTYEGQAAIELEQLAALDEHGSYGARLTDRAVATGGVDEGPWVLEAADLVGAVVDDVLAGAPPAIVASRFHHAVADAIVTGCERARASSGLGTVALTGGVFQNVRLVERAAAQLERQSFEVLTHQRIPPNDGGISLGQAAIVAARDTRGP